MNKSKLAAELMATSPVMGAVAGGPYSMQGFKLPNPSKRPIGHQERCCKCGVANTTLRKLDGDNRICQKCFDTLIHKKES